MKAFLLAAGNGSRLRPLTDDIPKCLLPIRSTPLLAYWLEICRQSGIDEVLINVSTHAGKIRDFAESYGDGLRIQVVEETPLPGSAGTLAANRDFVRYEEAFFVLYADVLTNFHLRELLDFHRGANHAATIGVYEVSDPQRCGIVSFDEQGMIQTFIEKPSKPESNWAFSGIMIAKPEIIDLVPPRRPADIGFHLLPQLVGDMVAYRIDAFLMDIGTIENYSAVQSSWPGLAEETKKDRPCCKV